MGLAPQPLRQKERLQQVALQASQRFPVLGSWLRPLKLHDVCRYPLQMCIVLQKVSPIRNVIYGMLASDITRDDSANKRIQVRLVNGLRAVPHQIIIRIQKLRSGTK